MHRDKLTAKTLNQPLFILLFLSLNTVCGIAQTVVPPTANRHTVYKTTEKFTIDGQLTEPAWAKINLLDSLYNKWPTDQGKASWQTEVKITYDDDFLYVAFKAYVKNKPVIQTLKRDGNYYWLGDGVMILIDALNQRAQGLAFALNAGGAQLDGIMQPGIGISWDWDGKWYSAVKQYDKYYTGEMAIPLQTLRFKEGQKEWGMNIIRNDMCTNTFSTWTNVPVAFGGVDLGYLGTLQFADELKAGRSNRVIIPYVTSSVSKNYEEQTAVKFKPNIGADAKMSLSSSLNLDLTVNPDFSQVDVDRQVINTERFSLFFPERRNFFLENSDLFANFGRDGIRPFFSRKIGIGEGGKQLPIIAGARLTGNITKDVRIGLLNVQTDKYEDLRPQNYTVASVEKRVLNRSNVKALFTNRQTTIGRAQSKNENGQAEYNRVGGAEFNYLSSNSKYSGSVKYFRSYNPGISNETDYFSIGGEYADKKWWLMSNVNKVGKNFITDAGFVPRLYNYDAGADTTVRLGFISWNSFFQYRVFSQKSKRVNMYLYDFIPSITWNSNGTLNEAIVQLKYEVLFKDRRYLQLNLKTTHINLPFETELFKNTGNLMPVYYSYQSARFDYYSDIRRPISWNLGGEAGSFYNGSKYNISGSINKRIQPWGNFGVNFSQTFVELNNKKVNVSLVSPMMEIAFSPTMYWTTFLQYNTQSENFNLNSRFQWRFRPMSDLFVVYTDNYNTEGLMIKNRSLVVKLNYWLNW